MTDEAIAKEQTALARKQIESEHQVKALTSKLTELNNQRDKTQRELASIKRANADASAVEQQLQTKIAKIVDAFGIQFFREADNVERIGGSGSCQKSLSIEQQITKLQSLDFQSQNQHGVAAELVSAHNLAT